MLEAAFQTFCSSCNLCLPLEDSNYGQLEKLIGAVWDKPIKMLFLSRCAMEVTGILRQTVENALTSVSQVNLMSLHASSLVLSPSYSIFLERLGTKLGCIG